ncbi:ATP-binding cassette domain-containing protein [Mesorhizobium sp. BAC0120]|uniref:ATP-binding cassette domain-containing protein n=1 Tax=Mesorhizobium sp. BAC0120 TaxID=3090670 RepID=UPI00298C67A1|nr:ATP-binding cassette domain-containing protein [Mesorhizobium sp. BAC0120]MDW6025426.1 ATP-binding cassette domain-containing protein [Mesorhizobium sp. BAC0120]
MALSQAPAQGGHRLALRNIHKRFGSVVALSGVNFEVDVGEVVALVGDNGAGKSTLTKIMSGAYRADEGEILFEGQPVHIASPEDAGRLGISAVYQDLALCENLDVVANLFLGRETGPRSLPPPLRPLDEYAMEARAIEVLSGLAVKLPSLRRPVSFLSGGQRQAVAVSRAVLWGSKVVLLDEPTAALGVEQTAMVLRLVRQLRDRGLAVVLISHNLSDVFRVADRIIVLRLGRRVASFRVDETNRNDVVAAITGGNELAEAGP